MAVRSCVFAPFSAVMNCLCNNQYDESHAYQNTTFDSDKNMRTKLLQYAVEKVNAIAKQSAYKIACSRWKTRETDGISYMRKIGQTKEKLETIAGFSVLDHRARLRLDLHKATRMKAKKDALDFISIERTN